MITNVDHPACNPWEDDPVDHPHLEDQDRDRGRLAHRR